MDINQLSEIVKKKIKKEIDVQKIIIEDKTYLHLNHSGHDKKSFISKFQLSQIISIKWIELKDQK